MVACEQASRLGGRTQFSRARSANAIQRAYKDCKKQACRRYGDHFICSTPALSVLFFFIIEGLVFYYKEPSNSQLFLCYQKNPVKCSACVVSQNIAIECGIAFSEIRLFLENHSLEFYIFSCLASAIRVNLLHTGPSLFLSYLFLSLWCLSTLASYYFKISFYLKVGDVVA